MLDCIARVAWLHTNTPRKNYRNWIVYVKIIASPMWDGF